jgi:adenosylcobinamide-GDP ribazoletransferase
MSGFSVVTFRCAKTSGLAAVFSNAAQKNAVRAAMAGYAFVSAAAMLYLAPLAGGAAVLGAAVVFIWYRRFSMKEFGGITGDLAAGFFLQVCKLVCFASSSWGNGNEIDSWGQQHGKLD